MRWKMRYLKRWKEDAVSPVIATILMVAITVVLAAVLYLLVSGILIPPEPEGSVNLSAGESAPDSGDWIIEVASISNPGALNTYKVGVLNGSGIGIPATDLTEIKENGASNDGLTITFSDATDNDDLNGGDWFILSGTDSTSDYQVVVYAKKTGNKLSGDTGRIEQ